MAFTIRESHFSRTAAKKCFEYFMTDDNNNVSSSIIIIVINGDGDFRSGNEYPIYYIITHTHVGIMCSTIAYPGG